MRSLALLLAVCALPFASCYSPNNLGTEPFYCSGTDPSDPNTNCPTNYTCASLMSPSLVNKIHDCASSKKCVCVFPCGSTTDCPTWANDCKDGICVVDCASNGDCQQSNIIGTPYCNTKGTGRQGVCTVTP